MDMEPVWHGYFADPFILNLQGEYYAYGTSMPAKNERGSLNHFPVLHSYDLFHWRQVGWALESEHPASFWAPEVILHEGQFFMYYSEGGPEGEGQQLRAAIASSPTGPFLPHPELLIPSEPFSIDADPHPDEQILFFAKDFLDIDRPGTGIAAIRLRPDLLSAIGEAQPILTPSADWQIYERDRQWYGRTWAKWHTVEGPCVVKRQGRFWLFYSGGLWKGPDYGVGIAVADDILGPYSDPSGAEGPSILHSGHGLNGPGHNSIVVGPDGEDYICFHAWDGDYQKRQMYIERLTWREDGPCLAGEKKSIIQPKG